MAPRQEDAARLTALGLHVVWLEPPTPGAPRTGKRPLGGDGWQLRPWTAEPPEAPRAHCNLGIQTGHVPGAPVQVVVVDCDSTDALVWAAEHIPPTSVRTKTGKGEHWFYRRPDAPPGTIGGKVKLTTPDGQKLDLDVKGDGGQVVAPPSVHYSGHVYAECEPWTLDAVAAMPVWDPAWVGVRPKAPAGQAAGPVNLDAPARPGLPLAVIQGRVAWALKHTRTFGTGVDAGRILAALAAVQAGKPYATQGERGTVLRDLTWVLAGLCPEATTDELVEYLAPSVMATLGPDEDQDTPDVGLGAAQRKLESARAKRTQEDRDAIAGMQAGLIRTDQPPAPLSAVLIVSHPRTDTVWVRKPDGTYRDAWRASAAYTYRDHPEGLRWAADAGVAVWWRTNGQGGATPKGQAQVMEEYSTPLDPVRYRMSLTADCNTFDPATGAFTEACAPLRRDIPARWDEGVDGWLRAMAGDEYPRLVQWLAAAPMCDRPIPVLAIIGRKGAGKGLLIDGLSRLWGRRRAPSFLSIQGTFNEAVAQSPLLVADEYLPDTVNGVDVFEYLRELVTARSHTVNRKHLPLVQVDGCVRLVYASNKADGLNFRNANPDAKAALAERFVHIQPGIAAGEYLDTIPDAVKTAWVEQDIIAGHVLWLHANQPLTYRGRLLVEGNGGGLIDAASNSRGVNGHLCEALARVLLDPDTVRNTARDFVLVGDGELWVATRLFEDKTAWESLVPSMEGRCYSTAALGAALGMLATESGRKRFKGQKTGRALQSIMHRVDVSQVYAYARRTGMGDTDVMAAVLATGRVPPPEKEPPPHDPQPGPGGPSVQSPSTPVPPQSPGVPPGDGPGPGGDGPALRTAAPDAGRCPGVPGTDCVRPVMPDTDEAPPMPEDAAKARGLSYLGSKARIADAILAAIQEDGPTPELWEPFMGGGSVTVAAARAGVRVHASERNESLALLWQACIAGDYSALTCPVSREEYQTLKSAPESARRGFVGLAGSFGSKWFGGYAPPESNQGRSIGHRAAGLQNAARVLAASNCTVQAASYEALDIPDGAVVYCDPPYAGTTGYRHAFDNVAFWAWAEALAKRCRVYVSEYDAPAGWARRAVFGHDTRVGSATGASEVRDEVLFYRGPDAPPAPRPVMPDTDAPELPGLDAPPAAPANTRKRLSPAERQARLDAKAAEVAQRLAARQAATAARNAAKRPKWERDHQPRDVAAYDPPASLDGLPDLTQCADGDAVRVAFRGPLLDASTGPTAHPLTFARLTNAQRAAVRAFDAGGSPDDAQEAAERAWMDWDGADHLTAAPGCGR